MKLIRTRVGTRYVVDANADGTPELVVTEDGTQVSDTDAMTIAAQAASAGVLIIVSDVPFSPPGTPDLSLQYATKADVTAYALAAIAATATASATLTANRHTPVDATGAARTMTLPTTAPAGALVSVEKTDASSNAVNVTGTMRGVAAQTIPLTSQSEARTFLSEGAGSWRPISDHRTKTSLDAVYGSRSGKRPVGQDELGVNVKDYGATGDGATDDTTAIRAAYAATPIGGRLVFPPGTYLMAAAGAFGSALNLNKGLTVTGSPGAVIKAAATAPTGTRLIQVSTNDVTIDGLTFDTSGISSATCVYATGAARLIVRDNEFIATSSGALCVNNAVTDLSFTGNRVYSTGGYGILVNDNVGNARLTFSHNLFNGGGGAGDAIEVNGSTNTHTDIVSVGNQITNYTSSTPSNGFGIAYANVTRGTIVGNVVSKCGRNGIHVECKSKNVTISGNVVSDCNHAGIEVQGEQNITCDTIVITGNTVRNCCLAPTINLGRGGIDIGSSTGAAFNGFGARAVVVSGNLVDGCRGAGIYLWSVLDSLVTNNLVCNTYGASTDTAHAVNNTGIHVISCNRTTISANRIVDTQTTATQFYPIYFWGSATGIMSLGNNYAGNLGGLQDLTTGIAAAFNDTTGAVRFDGGSNRVGFYNATPIAKQTGTPAAAVDPATTMALVNDLRAKLVALNLIG